MDEKLRPVINLFIYDATLSFSSCAGGSADRLICDAIAKVVRPEPVNLKTAVVWRYMHILPPNREKVFYSLLIFTHEFETKGREENRERSNKEAGVLRVK